MAGFLFCLFRFGLTSLYSANAYALSVRGVTSNYEGVKDGAEDGLSAVMGLGWVWKGCLATLDAEAGKPSATSSGTVFGHVIRNVGEIGRAW
jgi:hypothetical protein